MNPWAGAPGSSRTPRSSSWGASPSPWASHGGLRHRGPDGRRPPIYRPFGAVLAAVILYWVLGLPAVKAELALGRKRPLGRGLRLLSKYVYVILTAVVLVCGILYGGIG